MNILRVAVALKVGERPLRSFVTSELDGGFRHDLDHVQAIACSRVSIYVSFMDHVAIHTCKEASDAARPRNLLDGILERRSSLLQSGYGTSALGSLNGRVGPRFCVN